MEYEKQKLSLRSVIKAIMERHGYEFYSFLFNDGIIFITKEKGKLYSCVILIRCFLRW